MCRKRSTLRFNDHYLKYQKSGIQSKDESKNREANNKLIHRETDVWRMKGGDKTSKKNIFSLVFSESCFIRNAFGVEEPQRAPSYIG